MKRQAQPRQAARSGFASQMVGATLPDYGPRAHAVRAGKGLPPPAAGRLAKTPTAADGKRSS